MLSPFIAVVLMTVVPAMGAIWFLLNRYEGYFDERRVFFSLVVGFFVGLVASVFEVMLFPFWEEGFVQEGGLFRALVFFVAGFAFFESGCKVMVMGLKRFRGRRDAPYYGGAMGLGFGAMSSMTYMSVFGLRTVEASGLSGAAAGVLFALMAMVPAGGLAAHGATTVFVALGAARDKMWWGWGVATLLQMPVLACYWLWMRPTGPGSRVVAGVLALVYGIGLLAIAQKRVLDAVVPPEVAAQVRRARRREMRQAQRGAQDEDEA